MMQPDYHNIQVAALPAHLLQYVVPQRYARYTPIDQAVWRYVMRRNYSYLKDVAFYPYIPGLKAAGLTIERIPDLQEMNDALGKIGWGAVTVDGFIPPAAFMEFQSHRVLVIAADIRTLEHLEYTPAPDIIHESAGHAPIIADPEYHRYLSYFGSIGAKALSSAQDLELYEAIKSLSVLKEDPNAKAMAVWKAEQKVAKIAANMGEPSEMALLSRLHWWTVEYGLIGTLEEHKIYGAGLLSSIGESTSCMRAEVKKLVYDLNAVNYAYDITQPQPQLFVTPDFQNLLKVLEEFADTMAFRCGGAGGVKKAIASKNIATVVYSSGLQVSGKFIESAISANGECPFIRSVGPTVLAYGDRVLDGHGPDRHFEGFSSPVGKLKEETVPLEYRKLTEGEPLVLHYESGILVTGTVIQVLHKESKNILTTLTDCTVIDRLGKVLFAPEWGDYDLAVGDSIVSVFGGAADKTVFNEKVLRAQTAPVAPVYSEKQLELHALYRQVRALRQGTAGSTDHGTIWQKLQQHPADWLCALELLEVLRLREQDSHTEIKIITYLEKKALQDRRVSKLIRDGLLLLEEKVMDE